MRVCRRTNPILENRFLFLLKLLIWSKKITPNYHEKWVKSVFEMNLKRTILDIPIKSIIFILNIFDTRFYHKSNLKKRCRNSNVQTSFNCMKNCYQTIFSLNNMERTLEIL